MTTRLNSDNCKLSVTIPRLFDNVELTPVIEEDCRFEPQGLSITVHLKKEKSDEIRRYLTLAELQHLDGAER